MTEQQSVNSYTKHKTNNRQRQKTTNVSAKLPLSLIHIQMCIRDSLTLVHSIFTGDGTAETSGFAALDHDQTAWEGILTTNYFFVADNIVHIYKIIPSPFNYNFQLQKITLDKKTLQVNYPFTLTDLHQKQQVASTPVSYTHLDVYKRQQWKHA